MVWIVGILALIAIGYVLALPTGPTITTISNSTKYSGTGTIFNGTGNDTDKPDMSGGFIFTINLQGETQNIRWKAYVGNVTGTLVLDDADGYTIYDWSLSTSVAGEIYATRTSGAVTWSNINCSNATNIEAEEQAMNHTTNSDDNISATFSGIDHESFFVGTALISNGTCPTINLFVNDSAPTNDNFEEVLLYDGSNVIYTTQIYDNAHGFRTGTRYDFQLIVPERGYEGWSSSTAYYFYVELS